MDHIAVDLGERESQICVRSSDGTVLEERRCQTSLLGAYLSGRPKSRVVVETCSEAFGVADAALEVGHEVRVVPATLVRSLGVGARRTKTDRRDARAPRSRAASSSRRSTFSLRSGGGRVDATRDGW
jgi:hypothetical protein